MYNNIGGKIKTFATVMFILEAIAAAIAGILLISEDEDLILAGIGIIAGGFLFSWVSSWFIYGFGELIENSRIIAYNTRPNVPAFYGAYAPHAGAPAADPANSAMSRSGSHGYVCPKCKMVNDSIKPCERCGYIPN